MSNAKRDNNSVPTVLGALETDGSTPIPIGADPSTHHFIVQHGNTGTDHGVLNDPRDENRATCWQGLSSANDGTIVTVYATADGRLQVTL